MKHVFSHVQSAINQMHGSVQVNHSGTVVPIIPPCLGRCITRGFNCNFIFSERNIVESDQHAPPMEESPCHPCFLRAFSLRKSFWAFHWEVWFLTVSHQDDWHPKNIQKLIRVCPSRRSRNDTGGRSRNASHLIGRLWSNARGLCKQGGVS